MPKFAESAPAEASEVTVVGLRALQIVILLAVIAWIALLIPFVADTASDAADAKGRHESADWPRNGWLTLLPHSRGALPPDSFRVPPSLLA